MARIAFGEFTLDTHRRLVFRKGVPLTASPKIVDLLELPDDAGGRGRVQRGDPTDRLARRCRQRCKRRPAHFAAAQAPGRRTRQQPLHHYGTESRVSLRGNAGARAVRCGRFREQSEEAFRAYCHGQYLLQQKSVTAKTDALRWFEKSVQLDPTFARAHGGIANAAVTLALHMCLEPKSSFALSRSAATTALALEHGLADAHTALGDVSCFHERDWPARSHPTSARSRSARSPRRRITRSPATTCASGSWIGVSPKPRSRSVSNARRLRSPPTGRAFELARSAPRSARRVLNVLLLEPDYSYARYFYACALFAAERYEEALNELLFVQSYRGHVLSLEGECNARLGRRQAAESLLEELLASRAQDYVSPYFLARLYVALDDHESALAMLQAPFEPASPGRRSHP